MNLEGRIKTMQDYIKSFIELTNILKCKKKVSRYLSDDFEARSVEIKTNIFGTSQEDGNVCFTIPKSEGKAFFEYLGCILVHKGKELKENMDDALEKVQLEPHKKVYSTGTGYKACCFRYQDECITPDYLTNLHPDLSYNDAVDLLNFCFDNGIKRKECYGDGKIMRYRYRKYNGLMVCNYDNLWDVVDIWNKRLSFLFSVFMRKKRNEKGVKALTLWMELSKRIHIVSRDATVLNHIENK